MIKINKKYLAAFFLVFYCGFSLAQIPLTANEAQNNTCTSDNACTITPSDMADTAKAKPERLFLGVQTDILSAKKHPKQFKRFKKNLTYILGFIAVVLFLAFIFRRKGNPYDD